MAPAPSASAFPLHPNSCLLDEHDRMLFQHSHPTGTDAERTTLQEGVEGFSAAISKAIQPQSHALHLDQRAGTLPTHHRSNARVPGSSSQATKAAEDQPKYYKELTVRCTSGTGVCNLKKPPCEFKRTSCEFHQEFTIVIYCLLYTSDAADEEDSVDLGGRRIIKK